MFQYDTRYITLFTAVSRPFATDVKRRRIMTSRKARRFRAIFARNILKIHTFFMKYWYFRNYNVIKRIWNKFSFHTVFMKLVVCFISPRQRFGDIKHTTRFINTVWNENSFQILYLLFQNFTIILWWHPSTSNEISHCFCPYSATLKFTSATYIL